MGAGSVFKPRQMSAVLQDDDLAASAQIDAFYGISTAQIEAGLHAAIGSRPWLVGQQAWIGLDPSVLQTPYARLARLFAELAPQPGQRVIDLGSGYGRV